MILKAKGWFTMIWIKSALFGGTIVTVRYIFSLVNSDGDQKINKMKEIINFTEYLRIYSCELKMSLEEILQKYNFKSPEIRIMIRAMIDSLRDKKNSEELLVYMNEIMLTPDPFNRFFAEIIDYYGCTYSELLNKKLSFAVREMEKYLEEYALQHNEKKTLNNRVSFLAGCLAAIIFV
jgi:hypothetical protein